MIRGTLDEHWPESAEKQVNLAPWLDALPVQSSGRECSGLILVYSHSHCPYHNCQMTATTLHAVPHHSRVHRALNREQHSLYNCLLSILDDTRFVNEIRTLYPSLPVFVNLRCGLWYSSGKHETCYFKSTDGHFGNWSFSCVRLNLQVAEACCLHGGCLVIDATRRGKTFPVCSR